MSWFQRCFLFFILLSNTLLAGELTLRLGPGSLGNGGTNPLGIPPSLVDADVTWLTSSNWETSVSIIPGIFVGKRSESAAGFYLGAGGGIVISANGGGLGPYAALGYSRGETFKFNAELKQAIGVTSHGLVTPYAMRVGVSYDFGN